MNFGYTIQYVTDVVATVDFYEKAFGLKRKMVHESNLYAEMDTGGTVLAFAANEMAAMNGFEITPNLPGQKPAGIEIALVTEKVGEAYEHACEAGATGLKPPEQKPWGQTVSYVRDLNGCLVEICSPMGTGTDK